MRLLWDSDRLGTAVQTLNGYRAKPQVVVRKRKLTEAEDNAIGRAIRRRQNRLNRGWRPFGKR